MKDLIENIIQDIGEGLRSMNVMGWCVLFVITFMVYVMIYGKVDSRSSHVTDMQECVADGYKSYECRGILKGARYGKPNNH